ncbi:MAG: metallophosphoesterase [Acidobacteria bacterium]|nr:metallophosphoesterase [Acidobacteriota bacterium]
MRKPLGSKRYARRRGLITLSLSEREGKLARWGRSLGPEITQMDIHMRRLGLGHDGLKVAHLTDIHHSLYTPIEDVERAVDLTNQLRPDLVALTGDYVTFSPSYIWPVARVLGRLKARLGVFAVLGNHDFQVDPDEMTRALEAQQIRVLRNSHFALHTDHTPLWLMGVDDLWWGADDLEAVVRHVPSRDPKILLCHNPMGVRMAAEHQIDLVLSGHTHGGQVRLPLVGALYGKPKLGKRFIQGWNRLDGTQIYVSRGIGKVLLPLRVGCPPEIACLRLRSGNSTKTD